MKAKDLILIALVCANVTLASVALTMYLGRAEPAAVAATSSRAGDFVMVSGSIAPTREAVLVVDVVAKKALLYVPKGASAAGTIWEFASSRDLTRDFAGGQPAKP